MEVDDMCLIEHSFNLELCISNSHFKLHCVHILFLHVITCIFELVYL